MASTCISVPRKVTFSNLSEEQATSHKEVESSISEKKIKKIVLSTLKETSLSEFDALYPLKSRLAKLTKKCLDNLKSEDPDQEALITRIHHFIKTSKDINQETLDCLFLKGNWLDKIDKLAPRHKPECSGYVAYVAKLCEAEVEDFRTKIKQFSRKELIEAIKTERKNKEKMKIIWARLSISTPELKFIYLASQSYLNLIEPQYALLKKNLEKLKTKKFSVEELEQKGLPGSRNMIPDLIEFSRTNKAVYNCMAMDIFRQFLQKESDHLHKRIKNIMRADSKLMKKLGFETKNK